MIRLLVCTCLLAGYTTTSFAQEILSYYEIKYGKSKTTLVKEKKDSNDDSPDFLGIKGKYDLKVRTNTNTGLATVSINLEKEGYPMLEVYDMHGQRLKILNARFLEPGNHNFDYQPKDIERPFVVTLRSAGKLKKMKVIKFNSF